LILTASFGLAPLNGALGAASPQWPMYGHDSAHTGGSPANGPATAHLLWKFKLPTDALGNASPVVGPDGTIYMPSDSGFFAINPDGTLKWQKWTGAFGGFTLTRGAPAVAADGTVYVWKANSFSNGGRLYAINPSDGSVLWSFDVGDVSYGSPTIGPDGTIYIAGFVGKPSGNQYGNLYAINPNGTLKWVWHAPSANCAFETSAALGPDGTVYIQHNCLGLIALSSSGTLKWDVTRYGALGQAWDSPSVGPDGTIYIGNSDYHFYAINPDGTLKWRVPVQQWMYMSSSAISAGGSAIYRGDNGGNFYAFSSTGHILWRFQSPDHGGIYSAPALSANGLVYFTQEVTKSSDASLYAQHASNGSVAWTYPLGPADASPALAPDGTLYVAAGVPGGKETVYAFR
jgi:outer membrane protein assembly factor BamB